MKRMLFLAIILGSFSSNVNAENYNIATTQLIGEKDPDLSEDFVRNIFTKKEMHKSSLLIKSEPFPVNVVVLYSKIALFGFSTDNNAGYWSSSEDDSSISRTQSFRSDVNLGSQGWEGKSANYLHVRPVRAF